MEFIKGMDISMVKELEVSGASYYINGKQEDLFRILKECGTTMVRLRIWSDPFDEMGNSYGGGGNDLQTTIEIAGRTVENGMDFMLDFHYSDFWADPAKQIKPKAWQKLRGEALETAVYLHTVNTLKALKNHKLIPKWCRSAMRLPRVFSGRTVMWSRRRIWQGFCGQGSGE